MRDQLTSVEAVAAGADAFVARRRKPGAAAGARVRARRRGSSHDPGREPLGGARGPWGDVLTE